MNEETLITLDEETPGAENQAVTPPFDPTAAAAQFGEAAASSLREAFASVARPQAEEEDVEVDEAKSFMLGILEPELNKRVSQVEAEFQERYKGLEAMVAPILAREAVSGIAGDYGLDTSEREALKGILATVNPTALATMSDEGRALLADAARGRAIRASRPTGFQEPSSGGRPQFKVVPQAECGYDPESTKVALATLAERSGTTLSDPKFVAQCVKDGLMVAAR